MGRKESEGERGLGEGIRAGNASGIDKHGVLALPQQRRLLLAPLLGRFVARSSCTTEESIQGVCCTHITQ